MDDTGELLQLPYLDFNYTFREKNYLLKLKLKKNNLFYLTYRQARFKRSVKRCERLFI